VSNTMSSSWQIVLLEGAEQLIQASSQRSKAAFMQPAYHFLTSADGLAIISSQ
jgi:hypothetical protein